jgi:hypothetical protein
MAGNKYRIGRNQFCADAMYVLLETEAIKAEKWIRKYNKKGSFQAELINPDFLLHRFMMLRFLVILLLLLLLFCFFF